MNCYGLWTHQARSLSTSSTFFTTFAVAFKFSDDQSCSSQNDPRSEDYYKVLEIDYDASDDTIKLSYRRLALMWHPDKHKGDNDVTAKFQEINEAYKVLSDPAKRLEYDLSGCYEINQYTLREYLTRFKGMILTCNGLGIDHPSKWARHLRELKPG
ncbi:hypothetical protein BAE44_0024469 [Dichanthelium oligosanthes]|uniref:J domain-containing protein n=1 Tax=Dichanthelium oligosanthes TaxID=888268 RepID=A0A1E5UNR8_9POAL|nr:hypothetical protein BAE44_0024469 [Dichanthelium oligosanthes]